MPANAANGCINQNSWGKSYEKKLTFTVAACIVILGGVYCLQFQSCLSGALLAVNDRADVAAASGADVLHLGQDDLPVHWARRIIGDDTILGVSCHAPGEVDAAAAETLVDYFCTGPVWPTPTKPGRHAPGLALVRHAAETVGHTRPWFAIGGIDAGNLDEVLAAGAQRVVVVRAITGAADPRAAAARLRSALT